MSIADGMPGNPACDWLVQINEDGGARDERAWASLAVAWEQRTANLLALLAARPGDATLQAMVNARLGLPA